MTDDKALGGFEILHLDKEASRSLSGDVGGRETQDSSWSKLNLVRLLREKLVTCSI